MPPHPGINIRCVSNWNRKEAAATCPYRTRPDTGIDRNSSPIGGFLPTDRKPIVRAMADIPGQGCQRIWRRESS
eukprot:209505-Rhodomonas_salina.4